MENQEPLKNTLETTHETPRGVATTEFWLVLAANIITVLLAAFEKIEASWAAVAVTTLTGLYTLLRSGLKTKVLSK